MIDYINDERSVQGLGLVDLVSDGRLTEAARQQAQYMAESQQTSEFRDGESYPDWVTEQGYDWAGVTGFVGSGSSVDDMFDDWGTGSPELDRYTHPGYEDIGVYAYIHNGTEYWCVVIAFEDAG